LEQHATHYLRQQDPELAAVLQQELDRQRNQIELIASENIVSMAVLEAQGGIMTNKYAEGYVGRRYYGGCAYVDIAETLAINRLKELFQCGFANVQSHSGAQANQAIFMALMQPGDTFLGLSLDAGGHLTHGSPVNQSGKWFHAISYGIHGDTHLIDYDQVEILAHEHNPKIIIAGGSSYPRAIDFKRFRQIADGVGAYLMVDMAHFAGLVAGGAYPNPLPHAHVVSSTTHKTLRGPRGGIILTNDEEIAKKINAAVFPGLQGGPLMHVIAAKAVAFGEALKPEFKLYAKQVVNNAQALARELMVRGFELVSGGTDSHVLLVDLTQKGVSGKDGCKSLETVNMTCNKNSVPNDLLPPMVTSGIRLGSPAATTRGFKEAEFTQIGRWIAEIIEDISQDKAPNPRIKQEVVELCRAYPIYPDLRYD
jgi:glycine hydroxymethyltransferase